MIEHPLHSSLPWIFPKDYHVPLKAKCLWTVPLEYVHIPHHWQVGMRQRLWDFIDPCLNHYELFAFVSQEAGTDMACGDTS